MSGDSRAKNGDGPDTDTDATRICMQRRRLRDGIIGDDTGIRRPIETQGSKVRRVKVTLRHIAVL